MSELEEAPRTYSGALLAVIAIALVGRVGSLDLVLHAGQQAKRPAQPSWPMPSSRTASWLPNCARPTPAFSVTTDELGKSLGLTQKQLDERAQAIIAREAADTAACRPLSRHCAAGHGRFQRCFQREDATWAASKPT